MICTGGSIRYLVNKATRESNIFEPVVFWEYPVCYRFFRFKGSCINRLKISLQCDIFIKSIVPCREYEVKSAVWYKWKDKNRRVGFTYENIIFV